MFCNCTTWTQLKQLRQLRMYSVGSVFSPSFCYAVARHSHAPPSPWPSDTSDSVFSSGLAALVTLSWLRDVPVRVIFTPLPSDRMRKCMLFDHVLYAFKWRKNHQLFCVVFVLLPARFLVWKLDQPMVWELLFGWTVWLLCGTPWTLQAINWKRNMRLQLVWNVSSPC